MPSVRESLSKASKRLSSRIGMQSGKVSATAHSSSVASGNGGGAKPNWVVLLLSLVIQSLIIYYVYNLEGVECKCLRDWRHDFVKYYAILTIITSFTLLISASVMSPQSSFIGIFKGLTVIIAIMGIVNVYAFFTYIGDLNESKCNCAVEKQENLNMFMQIWRWVLVVVVSLSVIFVLLTMFALFRAVKSAK